MTTDRRTPMPKDGRTARTERSSTAQQGFKAPQTQDELDGIVEARLRREREKYKDYAEVKEKAEKYDKAQEASKAELQKLQERIEEAERKAAALEAEAERARQADDAARRYGVPASLLEAVPGDEVDAYAENLARLIDEARPRPALPVVLSIGAPAPMAAMTAAEQFAEVLEGRL
jgi:membrane-bound lytic murein transglycosylase B